MGVVAVGEIVKGIEKLPDFVRGSVLSDWLFEALLVRFEGRVLAIDVSVMAAWGRLVARQKSRGRKMPAIDALKAALAIHHDSTLATRNESDFKHAGIRLLNPWKRG